MKLRGLDYSTGSSGGARRVGRWLNGLAKVNEFGVRKRVFTGSWRDKRRPITAAITGTHLKGILTHQVTDDYLIQAEKEQVLGHQFSFLYDASKWLIIQEEAFAIKAYMQALLNGKELGARAGLHT
ncbi:hypothetical protein Baya_14578 [Bagarius yarrelli]|uniref:Uncharacterized protein n=1 Tax=Bagarius yarrelli TaxID=175774 RepID=A0A556V9K9_BAGYA|nr:hypothetical protein Baya_14578 [Bagarius yarrelli]